MSMDLNDGILCAAIAALWAYVVWSGKKCEQRNDALSVEIKETKDGVIRRAEEREEEARQQAVIVANALNEQTALSSESLTVMRDMKGLIYRTVRALKRYSRDSASGEHGDDSDTSKFFQEGELETLEPKQ